MFCKTRCAVFCKNCKAENVLIVVHIWAGMTGFTNCVQFLIVVCKQSWKTVCNFHVILLSDGNYVQYNTSRLYFNYKALFQSTNYSVCFQHLPYLPIHTPTLFLFSAITIHILAHQWNSHWEHVEVYLAQRLLSMQTESGIEPLNLQFGDDPVCLLSLLFPLWIYLYIKLTYSTLEKCLIFCFGSHCWEPSTQNKMQFWENGLVIYLQ